MIKDLLPAGSVIKIKGLDNEWMIYGIKQTDIETNINYDYIAVPWPEGNTGTKNQCMFNSDIISEIVFKGYENETRDDFLKKLSKYYNEDIDD